jgi:preprotein translocase subunit SecA
MRIFAAERMDAVMRRLGIKEDEGITHPWMNKAMETSQRKIEQRNFEIRKNVLKYDDVINDQRKAIFEQRMEFMRAEDVSDVILEMREHVIDAIVSRTMPEKAYAEQWDVQGLREAMRNEFAIDLPVDEWAAEEGVANKEDRPAHPRCSGAGLPGDHHSRWRRPDAPDRKADPASGPRHALARAPADDRPAAFGHPPAFLWPA